MLLMTEPKLRPESELIDKSLLLTDPIELEKDWAKEMEKNFIDKVQVDEVALVCCKHCGCIIYLPLSMQHLKLMHPEPYVAVCQKWEDLQRAKGNANSEPQY